jgi:plasmid stabilization system protein ParE
LRRDPNAAGRIGLGIYDRAQILVQHPEAGSALDELSSGGWRKLIFRRWKIIYTIRGQDIIVGRIWPAAMGEADLVTPL